MATLRFSGETTSDPKAIADTLGSFGIPYERWGVKHTGHPGSDEILDSYWSDIDQLKNSRGYVHADVISLSPDTPNLKGLLSKFDKEHHHLEDEVRFVVAGEGVFEIATDLKGDQMARLTTHPGDLIVIPEGRRHLFYLTNEKTIQCIRLFKDPAGWTAVYDKN